MNRFLLNIYHAFPPSLRSLAASAHGYRLGWWRYGSQTDQLVRDAIERELWGSHDWKAWQSNRVADVLVRAVSTVPYYREQWAERERNGKFAGPNELKNWPILSKEALRLNPYRFVSDGSNLRRMYREHTSGTTGTPLQLWWSRKMVRDWYALFEARWRGWYGLSRHQRWGIIGGQLVAPATQKQPPYWVWNAGLNQLYLSAYHLSRDNVELYLRALERAQVVYLFGYPSALHFLAVVAMERKLVVPRLKAVISNAEPLYAHQRLTVSQAFSCKVYDTYGMAEAVTAASECEAGSMHLWPEAGIVEILDDSDQTVPAGSPGRIVCTGLLNIHMPLVRYDTGDIGTLLEERQKCPCGRSLPMIAKIEGRKDDLIITPDGRHIGRLDPVFKGDMRILEAQIVQVNVWEVRIVAAVASGFSDREEQEIKRRLQERVGQDMRVEFERVARVPREANGKFRAVKSYLQRKSAFRDSVGASL